ncbi:MAG: acyl-CoA thioesterase [Candidatus Hermodarchaeota archaeon]
MSENLAQFPVVIKIPILWGYMDSYQHVNNVIFFRFFESVRIAYFDRIGFTTLKNTIGIGPILASTECKYKIPLKYPDNVSIGAKITELEEDRFTMKYILISHQLNKLAAEAKAIVVSYDYKNDQKVSIPQPIRNKIIELEKIFK